jgi:hypothetical protein
MRYQRGQSMTEFAVAAALLVLLMLGVITIGGYQEVQRRAATVAPLLAYTGAWSGNPTAGSNGAPSTLAAVFDDPALVSATGNSRLVRDAAQNSVEFRSAPGRADTSASLLLTTLQGAGSFLGGGFDLQRGGYQAGRVGVQIDALQDLPEPFRSTTLSLTQPYALLTDAWNSADPTHVAGRAGGLVPTQRLAGVASLWQALLAPLTLLEPALAELCLGLIEPDRIPEDRLGPGFSPLPGRCP